MEDNTNTTKQSDSTNASPPPQEPTVNPPQSTAPLQTEQPATWITPNKETKQPRSKKPLGLVVLLLVLAALGIAGWFILQESQPVVAPIQPETQDIQTLRIGSTEGPLGDVFPESMGSGISVNQSRQIYEGLIGGDDGRYVPLLAYSWTNPDQRTWLFKLRPDVKFHTGKTMTAQDVKDSLEAIKELDFWSISVSTIDEIEVISDSEVKITTEEPDALLLNRLSFAYIFDTSATDQKGNNGTGAYRYDTEKERTEEFAALIAFDEYHQGRPKTRSIEYKLFNSEAAILEAINKGEVDYAELIASDVTIPGFSSEIFEAPGVFGIFLNIDRTDSTPLKNLEVRKAIALAVDRAELIEQVGKGGLPAFQVVPKSLPGHDPSIGFPDHDVEAAKAALLTEYPEGVTLEYAYFEGVQEEAPILIEQLRTGGFTIEATPYTDPSILSQKLVDGEFDMFSGSYLSDIFDSRDILGSIIGSEGSYGTYKTDAAYEQLLNSSDVEFDPTKRIATLQEANQYIADNFLWIPLRKTLYTAYFQDNFDIKTDSKGGSDLGAYFWKVGQEVQ